MQIILNGQPYNLADDFTVTDLLTRLDLKGKLAVEINHTIVPRSQFPILRLNAGDRIEIVQAIGGG